MQKQDPVITLMCRVQEKVCEEDSQNSKARKRVNPCTAFGDRSQREKSILMWGRGDQLMGTLCPRSVFKIQVETSAKWLDI